MIKFSDITVIIQGQVYKDVTNLVIRSVKKFLPNAQIIFSTCDQNVSDTISGVDRLIVSKDPGGYLYADRPGEKENNINRQIINTLAALKQTKTPYALKIRSDFVLNGHSFLTFFHQFPKAEKKYRIFKSKVLNCCYFTRNPRTGLPFPFHPSDLAFFGRTDDLIKLFDIPLMTKKQAYWNLKDRHQYQYIPEQYLFINCLRQNGFQADCRFYNDCTVKNIEQTERYFASNFIFLTFEQFNLLHYKNTFSMKIHPNTFRSCYTHNEWLKLYQKYVDSSVQIPQTDAERAKIEKLYRNYRKYRLLGNICAFPFHNKGIRRKIRNAVLEFFLKK